MTKRHTCDVAIIGGGFAGSTLGLILARHGLSVSIVDHAEHPRFALGESLLRPTTLWMKVLAARYDVPELDVVAHADRVTREIAPTSGVKRCFSFLYHTPRSPNIRHSWFVKIPASFTEETLESHLFRQDIDAYLFHRAVAAGCRAYAGRKVSDIRIDADCAALTLDGHEEIHASYVVDASSFGSVIAKQFALRDPEPRLKTASRCLFNHLLDVKPYDELGLVRQPALPWHDGTLHHLFEGGWMWVIPFGNQPGSRNPLCSVGLNLDLRYFPVNPTLTAEEEWESIMSRFPSMARQFERAKPVRRWVSTGRLQYTSKSCVGDRFSMLCQANGSVDALYSRGLLNTLQALNTTAYTLLQAFQDGDFSARRFQSTAVQQENLLALNDDLVHGTYQSLNSSRLVQVWLGIYSLSERLSIAHVLEPFLRYLSTKNRSDLNFDDTDPGTCVRHYSEFRDILSRCVKCMDEYRRGDKSDCQTADELEALLRSTHLHGYDFDTLVSVVSQLNFTTAAKRYFAFEKVFLEILQGIDCSAALSTRLQSSEFLAYFVRTLCKQAVMTTQVGSRARALKSATFCGQVISNLGVSPDCEPLVDLDTGELRTALFTVQSEVAVTAERIESLTRILETIGRVQAHVCVRSKSGDPAEFHPSLSQVGWEVWTRSNLSNAGGVLSTWLRRKAQRVGAVLIVYETSHEIYLIQIDGELDLTRAVRAGQDGHEGVLAKGGSPRRVPAGE